jgi:hypothetical protein
MPWSTFYYRQLPVSRVSIDFVPAPLSTSWLVFQMSDDMRSAVCMFKITVSEEV